MNLYDFNTVSTIDTHFVSGGETIASTRYECEFGTFKVIRKGPIACESNTRLHLDKDINFRNSSLFRKTTSSEPAAVKVHFIPDSRTICVNQNLYIPTMIRCQNCETNYPTKYQYQRHQCDFNVAKVTLKPNADFPDLERGKRIKYDCPTCGKQFVSRNNLERHQTSHENPEQNTCAHCHKQFVSENRLRIHKENHCKKAGDVSKFYRSDVTVWKCTKCSEVFSSSIIAAHHVDNCGEEIKEEPISENADEFNDNETSSDNKPVEKISTEILLQCEYCNRTYAEKEVLLKHQKSHKTDRNYECAICKEVFNSYINASQHWLKKCSENSNFFYLPTLTYCEFCDRTFKSHELLYSHKIKKKHYTPKLSVDDDKAEHIPDKEIKSEESIDNLIKDVLIALEIPINKHVTKNSIDEEHKENDVSIEGLETTSGSTFENVSDEGSVFAEKPRRGRKRKYPKVIPRPNKKNSSLLTTGYKYQCERCSEVWDSAQELEEHRDKDHAASFCCDECGQILHSARALLIHSRAHRSLKPYVCDTCGRSYSQTSHLWQHMRFHQGIKPFACPHEGCEARYTIRPDLKDHIRKVHTRERPFKCNVCGKCFLTGSVYYQHRLIHTEDRRYACDMCDKKFFRADALNNHKRIHTNERPYPCFVCGRLFRQKGDRNKHFRTQHPDAITG